MKLKLLSASVLLSLSATGLHAAALDRSGQSIVNLFQPGNYAEVSYGYLSPEVGGRDSSGNQVTEMAKDYQITSATLKLQPNDQYSFALLYDEPFGAEAEFQGTNNFVSSNGQRTSVELESHNLTALVGFKPTPNFTVYAGPALQYMKGEVSLRGTAYSIFDGYDARIRGDAGLGYVAGTAFEIPDIALRVALTYRSEVEHSFDTRETTQVLNALKGSPFEGEPASVIQQQVAANLPLVNGGLQQVEAGLQQVAAGLAQDPNNQALLNQRTALETQQRTLQSTRAGLLRAGGLAQASQALPSNARGKTTIKTPQSVNLDFQTGIMADTLLFGNVRWVEWSAVTVQPPVFGQTSAALAGQPLNLLDYTDDQWSASLGVGRKLNSQWAANVSVGWDSGAGDPITTLGPTVGFYSLGLGARYTPVENIDISLGVRYLWLGDAEAKVSSGTVVGTFEENTAIAAGLKLGYRF